MPTIIQYLKTNNLKAVNLETMYAFREAGLFKRSLLQIWNVWELCFDKLAGLKPVGGQKTAYSAWLLGNIGAA
ncbi:hypothetical protein N752_15100 [Desulforamulus aquiferis]|nr:hypothetical protein [Desulforamulus aquiferis]RYD04698.1 hypothetical protein N752_15100 [Desulforamulus aquiferis]